MFVAAVCSSWLVSPEDGDALEGYGDNGNELYGCTVSRETARDRELMAELFGAGCDHVYRSPWQKTSQPIPGKRSAGEIRIHHPRPRKAKHSPQR